MNKKKLLINILCASLVFGNITPVFGAVSESESSSYQNAINETKKTEVLYTKSASYFVTIPKKITLGSDKASQYSVKVEGDIPSDKEVYVSPIDSITETDYFDFYMKDQNTKNPKEDVAATVTQSKFYWNFQDTADAYVETNNKVSAEGLSAGTWRGVFDFEINVHKIDLYETAPDSAYINWNYTLDDTNNIITLNYYTGSETDVSVYGNYVIGEKIYKTQLASNVEDTKYKAPYMFNASAQPNCKNIRNITFSNNIDMNNITNMAWMFRDCSSLVSLDLDSFNTGNVTNMAGMFMNCNSLTSLDLGSFETGNVTNVNGMFMNCSSLTSLDLGGFETSNVMNMSNMFSGCKSLTSLDLSSFDTCNVTNMKNMFYSCLSLASLNLSSFNTSNVTNMNSTFFGCSLSSLDVGNLDTSNVTDMGSMFAYCAKLTSLDLSSFDTSNVTDMGQMFEGCVKLTSLDLSGFDVSKVTRMLYMFKNCSELTSIYASQDTWSTSTARYQDLFVNCGTSSVTYK